MKRILIFILVIFLFNTYDVLAKEIIVNDILYDDEISFEGEGYSYNSNSKKLFLDGYNGGSISYDGLLHITLYNENVINGNSLDAINCLELSIYGNGTLNIYNANRAIVCERLQVQYSKMYITKSKVGIIASGIEIYLSSSKLVIDECDVGIISPDNIYLGSSTMNILECDIGIRNHDLKTLTLNNSNLYIKTNSYCLENIEINSIYKSKIFLESSEMTLNDSNILESDDTLIYASDDKNNYFLDEDYFFYPFIKIAEKDKIEELLISNEGLIIEVDKSFLEKKDEDKESDIKEPNTNENLGNDILENDKDDIEEDNKEDNPNDLNKEEEDLSDNDKNNNTDYIDVVTKNEYTEGVFNDIEIDNPHTFDSIYIFFIIFIISLLVLILCFLRRKNG